MKLKLFSVYGVISPPKFKLLFATLSLWIFVHFYAPIVDFYNSTLPSHNSVSIFQMQCVPITWDIHSQCSMSLYGFIRCKMRYACNTIQHSYFPLSQSISIICFQISSFDMRHSYLSMQCWYLVCMLRCRVRHDCYTTQYSSLDLSFTLEWPDLEMVSRWTKCLGLK